MTYTPNHPKRQARLLNMLRQARKAARREADSMVSGETKRSRTDVLEERAPQFSTRKVYFPIFLDSTRSVEYNANADTATADLTFDMKDTPMHIPTHAQNVYAYAATVTIPRTNLTQICETNFTRGGRGVDGQPNTAIFMRDGNLGTNSVATYVGLDNALKVPCTEQLKGEGLTLLHIRWVDQDRNLIDWSDASGDGIFRNAKWNMTIIIEWEETIDISRLIDKGTETKHR